VATHRRPTRRLVANHPHARCRTRLFVATAVPEWGIPYVARITSDPVGNDSVTLRLIRGAMRRYGSGLSADGAPITPIGRLLTETDSAAIDDAEVPRDGVRVQRIPMLARRPDGGYDLWTIRRVTVGRGEGRSGLEFDSALPRLPVPEPLDS
jgi:hypothetical protein